MTETSANLASPSQDDTWTIKRVVAWSTEYLTKFGSPTARLDTELLLSQALNQSRLQLFLHYDKPLLSDELKIFRQLLKRRALGEPIAYLTGKKSFMNHEFVVNADVLIPRPETEILAECALQFIKDHPSQDILDICSGSGCIALSLASGHKTLQVDAWEISEKALQIARQNQSQLAVDNCNFFQKDILVDNTWKVQKTYDLVVSNPPYLTIQEYNQLKGTSIGFEPKEAFLGGDDGLVFYRLFAEKVIGILKPDGIILLEVGHSQADQVSEYFHFLGWQYHVWHKDLSGIRRVFQASPPRLA